MRKPAKDDLPLQPRKPFYSPREVAQIAGVSPSTAMSWIHDEKLYAVRLSPRVYRIPIAAVVKFLYPEHVRITRRVEKRSVGLKAEMEAERRRLRAEHGPDFGRVKRLMAKVVAGRP